jgi:hypothetical protein
MYAAEISGVGAWKNEKDIVPRVCLGDRRAGRHGLKQLDNGLSSTAYRLMRNGKTPCEPWLCFVTVSIIAAVAILLLH